MDWRTLLKAAASPSVTGSAAPATVKPNSVQSALATLDVAWAGGASVSRAQAMSIPAFAACRNLIAGTVAQMSMQRSRGSEILTPGHLITQPDPDTTLGEMLEWTIDDLLLYGSAAWLVIARDGIATSELPQGYPVRARRLPPGSWSPVYSDKISDYNRLTGIEVGGQEIEPYHCIVFWAGHEGILKYGAKALSAALSLEDAAGRIIAADLPAGILKNEAAELGPDEAQELVQSFVQARKTNAIAFLQGISYETPNVRTAVDLQMAEARGIAATEIARLFNVPVQMIGAAPTGNGSSLTYSSVLQSWSAFVKQAVGPVIVALEQGLTRPTVTPRGQQITFGVEAFLRSDPQAAVDYTTQLVAQGIITPDEARSFLGIPTAGQTIKDTTPGVV